MSDRLSTLVDGARIAFEVTGGGPSNIVLVHGFAAHRHWWDAVIPMLAPSCRVVALDLSGHGDSDHRESYSIDTWAHEIDAVRRAVFGDAPAFVAAHSIGGRAALAAARLPDHRVTGVVLVDTVFLETLDEPRSIAWKGAPRSYESREAALSRFRLMPPQPLDDDLLVALAGHSVRQDGDGWTWKYDQRSDPGRLEVAPLTTLAVPLTISYGALSSVVDAEMARRAAARAGAVDVVAIPDAHHHAVLEQPAAVARIILDAIASTATPPDPGAIQADTNAPER